MRVVADIDHPRLKVTILHHNSKYTVQIEDGDLSQSYILREGHLITGVNDVKAKIDEDFLNTVESSITQMRQKWQDKLLSSIDDSEFEHII